MLPFQMLRYLAHINLDCFCMNAQKCCNIHFFLTIICFLGSKELKNSIEFMMTIKVAGSKL